MDNKLCLVFLIALAGVVTGYPTTSKDEVEFVPLEHQRPGQHPGLDFDFSEHYFPNPFEESDVTGFEALMERMRKQLATLFRNFPTRADFPDSDSPSGFPAALPSPVGVPVNTNTVTKIIDGHKVVVHESNYKTEGPNGGAYFKVKVIDIKPTEGNEEAESSSTTSAPTEEKKDREVEPLEDSIENEIPKNKEGTVYGNIETFDDIEGYQSKPKEGEFDWSDVEPLETFEDNSLNFKNPQKFHDLSNDIYVNQLLADAGAPTNPDAEFISGFEARRPREAEVKRRIR